MSDTTTLEKRAIDRQNRAWASMTEITERAAAESRDLTAEERASWDAAEKDVDEAGKDIERFQRAAKLDKVDRDQVVHGRDGEQREKSDVEQRYDAAFRHYLARGLQGLSAENRSLLTELPEELRALGTAADNVGGYMVPEGFRNKIVEAQKAYGGIAEYVEHITTATGNPLPWVTNDDTGNEGEIIGENEDVSEQDIAFGGRRLAAFIFSSKMIRVPVTLLQDAAFDVEAFLARKFGERLGRRSARAWLTGTGVDQPEGILKNVTVGKTGANGQTTTITYNDIIDLEHSLDPAYRRAGARFVLGDPMLKGIRKIVDGQQRPLWVPVPAVGMTPTINGIGYVIDNSMPAPAASANTMLYADLAAAYVIRTVLGVQTVRLTERYAEKLQVAFFAYQRQDGMVQDPNAVRTYQQSAV
jgi:HK97 family phage major capsid protein